MASTLSVHSAKYNAEHVTFDFLKALPEPPVMGPHHKPIPHHVLIDGFRQEATARRMTIVQEQFALGAKGAALFGVMDFEHTPTTDLGPAIPTATGLSLGFRSANNLSLAIRAVAGARVFVCDNLALSGDMFAISRKHTNGLDLEAAIRIGFDKFMGQACNLATQIANLNVNEITDDDAKILIFNVFNLAVLPVKLFADVNRFYFEQSDDRPDCRPRTSWGLHNAITRAIKDLKPVPAFAATVAAGRFFGLTGTDLPDIDVTPIMTEDLVQ